MIPHDNDDFEAWMFTSSDQELNWCDDYQEWLNEHSATDDVYVEDGVGVGTPPEGGPAGPG